MSHPKLQYKGRTDKKEVLSYLEEFIDGLRKGSVHMEESERSLLLHPAEPVDISIKADQGKDSESFNLRLTWPRLQREMDNLVIGTEPDSGSNGHGRKQTRSGSSTRKKSNRSASKSGSGKSSNKNKSRSSSKKSSRGRSNRKRSKSGT